MTAASSDLKARNRTFQRDGQRGIDEDLHLARVEHASVGSQDTEVPASTCPT